MNAITRAQYLTHHYQDLQGYRLLPFAAAFLVIALNTIWLQAARPTLTDGHVLGFWQSALGLPVSMLLIAFIASHFIGKSYEVRYGRTKPAPGNPLAFSRNTYSATALLALLFGLLFAQPWAGPQLTWLWLTLKQPGLFRRIKHVPVATVYLCVSIVLLAARPGTADLHAFNFSPLATWSLIACAVTTFASIHNHRLLLKLRTARAAGEIT